MTNANSNNINCSDLFGLQDFQHILSVFANTMQNIVFSTVDWNRRTASPCLGWVDFIMFGSWSWLGGRCISTKRPIHHQEATPISFHIHPDETFSTTRKGIKDYNCGGSVLLSFRFDDGVIDDSVVSLDCSMVIVHVDE
jgi:hypothetical protein